jgi:putative phosphotransacetylase
MFALFCRHSGANVTEIERLCKKIIDFGILRAKIEPVMAIASPAPHRAVVEHLVRQAVYSRLGKPLPRTATAPNPLVVNVSARHCHLTPEAVEVLFGKGHQLQVHKWLYQEGQFAARETVTLIGPRSRVISNLRILGPCRNLNQVELAYTDAIALGFEIPLRLSGNIKGTPGGMLMGPAGFFEMNEGVIRAARHVHMNPVDADFYGVKNGDQMKLRIGGDCGITLDRMLCRVDKSFKLEVHIDTYEGNACNLQPDTPCELTK